MKRPFLPAAIFMLLALWPMYRMSQAVQPDDFQLQVYSSAVLQAEFHRNSEDVYKLYGAENTPLRLDRCQKIRRAHWFDNLFLCLYGLFLAAFAGLGFRWKRQNYFLVLLALGVIAAFSDWMENDAIVGITESLDSEKTDFDSLLWQLQIFTWLKWLSLAAYFGLLVRFFRQLDGYGKVWNWVGKILSLASVLTVLIALIAFATKAAFGENYMAQAISLMFAGLFLFSLFFQKRKRPEAGES